MGINHIDVIEQLLGCLAGIDGGPESPKYRVCAAQCQRMVSNSPVIMKANAMA